MLTRRWRGPNSATGDEQFQNKMLKDFREFCSNQNNRLLNFWDHCWMVRDEHQQFKQQAHSFEPMSQSSVDQPSDSQLVSNIDGMQIVLHNGSNGLPISGSTLEELPERL